MSNLKGDPIQGIYFKRRPVHLTQKAAQRAKSAVIEDITKPVFFEKIRSVKSSANRLNRRLGLSASAQTKTISSPANKIPVK